MTEPAGADDGAILYGGARRPRVALVEQIQRAAGGFRALGLEAGGAVALLMRNDPTFVVAGQAAGALGAVATPINWHFSAEEAAYVIEDCGARIVVAHADLWRRIADGLPPGLLADRAVILVETPDEIARAYNLSPERIAPPEGLPLWSDWLAAQKPLAEAAPRPQSTMIYTSGTTGRPKGVRRLGPVSVAAGGGGQGGFTPDGVGLLPAPLYHSAPNRFAVSSFLSGMTLLLTPRFDAEETLALIAKYRVTHAFMVPTMLIRILRLPEEVKARYDLSSLRHVVHAGAPCPPEVKRAIIEWWGPVLYEYYGCTETGLVTYISSAEWLTHPGSVGRPVPNATVKVLDEDGAECPTGVAGEIYARLHDMPDFTYQGRPEERAAVERDGLVTCGDIGKFDADGYLYITDRKRDMVISGGVNIYPAQVESALHMHPAVADCAVYGVPDPEMGETLVAAVQMEPGGAASDAELTAFLKTRIAGYMIPRIFERHEALPRDPSGKIYKRKLRDAAWAKAGRQV